MKEIKNCFVVEICFYGINNENTATFKRLTKYTLGKTFVLVLLKVVPLGGCCVLASGASGETFVWADVMVVVIAKLEPLKE